MRTALYQQCALSHQLRLVPSYWRNLTTKANDARWNDILSTSNEGLTAKLIENQIFSNGFFKSLRRFTLRNECRNVQSFPNTSIICVGDSKLLRSRESLKVQWKRSANCCTSGCRFYHKSLILQDRQTNPHVEVNADSKTVKTSVGLPKTCSNEQYPSTEREDLATTSQNVVANTDFELQLTLAQKFVKSCPSVAQPYLQLMRIDRPIGTWLLFWPCGWGLALAAGAGNWPDPGLLITFGCGALVMRGAGCTINDLWDRDIDSKVVRTQDRPLASGAVQPLDALVFLAAQLGTGLLVLLQLNWHSILLGSASLGLVCTYPLVKRVWHWPQLVLGLTFNWGVLLGWCAVHSTLPLLPVVPLYAAGVFWTLIYDTIYAHQDKSDDLSIGIKSTAIMFGDQTAAWLGAFGAGMVGCLLLAGWAGQLGWPHYAATAAVAAHIAHQVRHLDIHNRAQCGRQFRHNRHVGLLVFLGLVGGSLLGQASEPGDCDKPGLWKAAPTDQLLLRD